MKGDPGEPHSQGASAPSPVASSARPLFSRTLVFFMLAMVLANIGSRMQRGLVPLYLQSLGADVGQVGLFFTIASIVPLTFQILGGFVSDSLGRLQAIAIGSVAGLAAYAVYVFAPSWRWLLLAQAADSMASCFVAPSFQAFVAEQSTEATRGRVFASIEAIYMIVGVVGPPLGGFISEKRGFRAMFIVAAILYALASSIRFAMARHARKRDDATGSDSRRLSFAGLKANILAMASLVMAGGVVTWIFISDGVSDIAFAMIDQLEPLYLKNIIGLSATQIGFLSSILYFATMILVTFGGWLSDKVGERVGIVAGHALVAAGLGVFLIGKSFPYFAVVWFLFGAGNALSRPAYSSLISKAVPSKLRGTAYGLFSTSLGVVSLPAPYFGALLWQKMSPRAPFVFPLIATVALMPFLWFWLGMLPPCEDADGAVEHAVQQ